MEITDIKIFKTRKQGPVLGYANVIFDQKFIIRGITLLETEKRGRFISMPARLLRNTGEMKSYRDICHPISRDIHDDLTNAIFSTYDDFLANEEQ